MAIEQNNGAEQRERAKNDGTGEVDHCISERKGVRKGEVVNL